MFALSIHSSPLPLPTLSLDFFTVLYFPNQILHPLGFFDEELLKMTKKENFSV